MYAAASADFQTGMWNQAERGFAQFVQRYPKSTNAPMAVLLEAQAQFRQKKMTDAIALLAGSKGRAGELADQYVSWIGEAQFADGNEAAAAATFISLGNDYPDSPLRLRATVEAAAAYGRLQRWPELSALLESTNGVFARKAELDAANELVSRGRLLLAQARLAQQDFAGTAALLQSLNPQALKPELDWQRAYLLCQAKLAAGDLDAALAAATNLRQIAQLEKNESHRAEGAVLRAELLEKLGQVTNALAAYRENLAPGTPDEKQREAIWKMASLAADYKQYADAERSLVDFLNRFPDSAPADIALLSLGELRLQDQPATNQLAAAQEPFDLLLKNFPNSALTGKALLDRGWCQWLAGDAAGSLVSFESAVRHDLSPADLAVARFKAGDARFALNDFKGARESYRSVYPGALADNTNRPAAERDLAGRAMYQSLRASLELKDTEGATNAFAQVFQMFSAGELGQGSALLYGESLVAPAAARSLFERLAPQFSGSPLEPELQLAIARTYEQAQDWVAAATNYAAWAGAYPTNRLRPEVDFALALATFQAGNEPGALNQFTRFVMQNPVNPLAPQAQWWVAEHFYRAGEYVSAETNYEAIFQNTNAVWKSSPLVYQAQLMAGCAAVGRQDFSDAVKFYFFPLISDTNCPYENLRVKARFACGAALMHMDLGDTTTSFTNLQTALILFNQIVQANPTNELGARAWGEIGDCDLQLGDLSAATNAYAQVFSTNSPAAISVRSRAQFGFGLALEKMAALAGTDQAGLRNLALDNYLQIFNAENLRDEKEPDLWWVKEAGLQAAPLVGLLNDYATETNFYGRLKLKLPQLADQIDKKIAALPVAKN